MPDEEMEMAIDFSHAGYSEDIDIDLDFPAGEPDEDMDLGDFDRSHDIQNFSSDIRDEMMAEGDDSSYGMMDAIEIDRNASAAGNDIDIDLEHVEGIWQNPSHPVDFNTDTEINYLDDTSAEVLQTHKDHVDAGMWLPLGETNAQDIDAMGHIDDIPLDTVSGESEAHQHLLAEPLPAHAEPTGPLVTSHIAGSPVSPKLAESEENRQLKDVKSLPEDEIVEVMTQASDKPPVAEQGEHNASQPNTAIESHPDSAKPEESYGQLGTHYPDDAVGMEPAHVDQSDVAHDFEQSEHFGDVNSSDVKHDHADTSQSEEADQSAGDASEYQTGTEPYIESTDNQTGAHDDAAVDQSGGESLNESTHDQSDAHDTAAEYQLGSEPYIESTDDQTGVHGDAAEYQLDGEQFEQSTDDQDGAHDDPAGYQPGVEHYDESTDNQDGAHGYATEYQLDGEPYTESTNDQIGAGAAPQAETHDRDTSRSVASSPGRDLEEYQDGTATGADTESLALEVRDRDDPLALADYYGIFISYGKTDYSLFASAEDDDPNQYFLTDKGALDIPLSQFLGNLREIISDEISPLDELVMHVDGLGLEFSESTTLDFLEKFTFGDLVILYDKLVKNEQAESSPPIYTCLTIKPNCNRRMMALGDSANAGRGLSEVALYRAPSSIADWQESDAGSPDTDLSIGGDYNDGENSDHYLQEDDEEEAGSLSDGEPNSTEVTAEINHESTPNQLEHPEPSEQTHGLDHEGEDGVAGNVANAPDDEQDSKQGICPFHSRSLFPINQVDVIMCDDCFEAELNRCYTPRHRQIWPDRGKVLPTRPGPQMKSMTNRQVTEDNAATPSSVLQEPETVEQGKQPSYDMPESGGSELPAPTISMNPSTDAPNSDNTSVTATLDGEDHDEIDYSDDENEGDHGDMGESNSEGNAVETTVNIRGPVDDEITWESDNEEETKNETKGDSPKDTVQVLPVSGKRSRSESDSPDGTDDKNDHKRLRS